MKINCTLCGKEADRRPSRIKQHNYCGHKCAVRAMTADPDATVKTCKTCHATKPLEDFHKHKTSTNGRHANCKDCQRPKSLEWYHRTKDANRDKRNAYERLRFHSHPKRRKKKAASWLAREAVRLGKLVKKPCEKCGDVKSFGHHEDYNKPLEVIWLCQRHHTDRHMELKRLGVQIPC